ncbi:phage portal protein [Nonomuraea sp. GTA35]|uniref:phage portal protein n=1 Tax=Nonomuraea sp. GTA35 TaxID=1676746 RepID=UPI0035C02877
MRSPLRTLTGRIIAPANKAPVPYEGRARTWGGRLFGSRTDAEAQMRTMGSIGTVFGIVHRTSNAFSQVEWGLWEKAESGLDEDRKPVTRHLALDIWNRPNPFYTGQLFRESFQQHLDLVGEAVWVVARNPRMRQIPLELWPVRPDRIEPVPSRENFLAGYVYIGPDGEQVPLRLDEVIRLMMPNPLDPYRGMGPIQSVLSDIDAAKYSAQWNRSFFINSALPGGIIEVPGEWSDGEFEQFRDRWEEQHRGVAAAHRVALLENGAKWVERKFTMKDMQFTEMRGLSREIIREAYTIPKFALGIIDDVNRATAEASKAWFAEMLTVPRLERAKGALNSFFLPLFGDAARNLEFDYCDPVPADAEARDRERLSKAEAAQRLVIAGWAPDDVADAVGLPRMTYVGPPAGAKPPALSNQKSGEQLLAGLRGELPAAPVAQDEDEVERLVEQAMEAIRTLFENALDALLAAWDTINAAWRRDLVDQVRQAVEDDDVAQLASLAPDTDQAKTELADALIALARAAAQQLADEAAAQGVTVEPADPDESGLGATAVVVVALLAAGLAAAAAREALRVWGPDAQPNEVAHQVDEHLRGLSDRTLRDELGGALHHAQQEGRMATLEDAPDPEVWIASERNDANSCANCREVDDKRFTDYASARAAYPVGAYRDCLGRTRCRGTIVPIWEEQ